MFGMRPSWRLDDPANIGKSIDFPGKRHRPGKNRPLLKLTERGE
jgi:hypothetical protein